MAAHRTAVLRHDAVGQETLLNLLLRNYLHYNLYDQVTTATTLSCQFGGGEYDGGCLWITLPSGTCCLACTPGCSTPQMACLL
jgi:hypothetical protein